MIQKEDCFQKDGPLDMRMNKEEEITAEQWINTATEKEISDVLFHLGEERKSRFYARKLLNQEKRPSLKARHSFLYLFRNIAVHKSVIQQLMYSEQ